MLVSSPTLTLITLGAAPIIAICGAMYGLFVAKLSQRYQKALADASDVAQQALSSIRTVRSFAREEYERHRYDGSVTLSYMIGAKRAAALGVFIGFTSTIAQVALVAVLWYGCLQVIDGHLDIGELTSFLLLAIYTVASLGYPRSGSNPGQAAQWLKPGTSGAS
jgi:ABC-type multidrug transport system fused ATPase/permease subunit